MRNRSCGSHGRWGAIVAAAMMLALAVLVLSACGSSSSSSTSSSAAEDTQSEAETTPTAAAPETSYAGPEAKFFEPFPTPKEKAGTAFKVGYLQVYGAIPQLASEESGAAKAAQELGGSLVGVDAELDIQKQAAGFEQLLAQNVDAIVGAPVVAKALAPQLAKAEAAGIPVITTASQPGPDKALAKGIMADVSEGYDLMAYENMKALAAEEPGGRFVTMGLAAPVEALEYYVGRAKYWGEKFGLTYEGEIDTKEDNPEAFATAANAILGKYPEATMIVTYDDLAGLSTSTVAQQAGREVLISGGTGGSAVDIEAVKAGKLFSVYFVPWQGIGEEMVRGAYNAVSGQGLPLAERTVSPQYPDGVLVTAANADEVEPTIAG
jgi:ribose transport system substrate-binding protein